MAGSDTTSVTVIWAMAQLLRNPEKRAKARAEIEQVIGGQNDEVLLKESDISKLTYLQAIIKETFRLHPADPLLVPHRAEEDVEINGYVVPKDSNILVNVWATGRDSEAWSDRPDEFVPERFLESRIDARGQHFGLIPFGSGRRMCPGQPLAHRMVHLMVAALIRNFEWKLEEGMKPEDIDMNEKFGLAVQKAVPLKAIPIQI